MRPAGSDLDKTRTATDDEPVTGPLLVRGSRMARVIDISASRRIGVLTRLVEDMGRLSDPLEAFEAFYRGMREAFDPMNAVQLSTLGLAAGEFRVFGMRAGGV